MTGGVVARPTGRHPSRTELVSLDKGIELATQIAEIILRERGGRDLGHDREEIPERTNGRERRQGGIAKQSPGGGQEESSLDCLQRELTAEQLGGREPVVGRTGSRRLGQGEIKSQHFLDVFGLIDDGHDLPPPNQASADLSAGRGFLRAWDSISLSRRRKLRPSTRVMSA